MLARLCDRCGHTICEGDSKIGRVELKAENDSGTIFFSAEICETCFGALKNFMSEGKMQKELIKLNEQVVRKNVLNRAKEVDTFS
ncbi:MAG: hypothetical protein K6C94_06220 [Candidatus Gastranaerophilales bacterium]|nr:hypothetical protein [Candidatus Gastranaerophilales bacterium]